MSALRHGAVGRLRYLVHLVRRCAESLSRREPAPADVDLVREVLLPAEYALWTAMRVEDRRHAVSVLRRFVDLVPDATREERAGAALHDVGKIECDLGTLGRVAATIVGPRSRRLRSYHEHEAIGAAMLAGAGSSQATIDLVVRRGERAALLRLADDTAVVPSRRER